MNSSIWVEKYRPQKIDDLVLSDKNKNLISTMINQHIIPNMTLSSKINGVGKTSIAKMLANMFCEKDEILFINGSLNRSIDMVRNEMTDFVYRENFAGNKKVCIIDEADGITKQAQDSLRTFIEEWSDECSFIFTCNDITKIIPAIQSRCPVIDLTIKPEDRKSVAKQIYDRCAHILRDNLIEFEDSALKKVISGHFPDIRQIINVLQRLSLSGKITLDMVENQEITKSQEFINELEVFIVDKDWAKIRGWAHDNYNNVNVYQDIYDALLYKIDKACIPDFITLTGEYSYRANNTNYLEINLAAYLAELCKVVQINV